MTSADVSRAGGRARRIARAVALGAAVAVAVTTIAFLVRSESSPLVTLDQEGIRLATDITRPRPALRQALLVWQEMTQPLNGYVVASLVCLWFWLRKGMTTRAWWAFITMMVGWNIALVIKYIVQRARPVVEDAVSHAPGYSFPSGHAANAAIVSTSMVLLLWPLLSTTGRRVAVGLAAAYTLVTSLDRVFLGVHYPSDVTAGVLLGVGLVGASYLGYRSWNAPHGAGERI